MDRPSTNPTRLKTVRHCGLGNLSPVISNPQGEDRPLPHLALSGNRPSEHLHRLGGDGQSQARALGLLAHLALTPSSDFHEHVLVVGLETDGSKGASGIAVCDPEVELDAGNAEVAGQVADSIDEA